MKKISILGIATLGFLWAGMTLAQEDEEATTFSYATYLYCDTSRESEADEDTAADVAVMDKLVADGAITGWGWLAHHTGGQWRRLRYHTADSLEGAFDGLQAINEALTAAAGDDDDDSDSDGVACPRHDDYVWQTKSSGAGDDGRGDVSFSVYFLCDITREGRADEIVDEHIAPILNKIVEDGGLNSWGWLSHSIGGKYRRLQTMTAPDVKTVLAARATVLAEVYAEGNELGDEFAQICGKHTDYLWNIVHETP